MLNTNPSKHPATDMDPRADSSCDNPKPREECREIEVGGTTYRYAIIEAEVETPNTAIVDFGGPGISALSGKYRIQDFKESLPALRDYNLLVIEEPWVTAEPEQSCTALLSAYYETARSGKGVTESSVRLARSCLSDKGRWGFDPSSYRSAVDQIEEHENISLRGFIGYSFGSQRIAYLEGRDMGWAVLVRPFPVGASGSELLSSRLKQTKRLRSLYSESETGGQPEGLPPNSETSTFDYASAELALAYLNQTQLQSRGPDIFARQNDALAARLSDSLWLRYGVDSISPGYLAYLSEVCVREGTWEISEGSQVANVLNSLHAPCSSIEETGKVSRSGPAEVPDETCIVTSETDPLASESLIKEYIGQNENTSWLDSPEDSHVAQDGTSECLREVGL